MDLKEWALAVKDRDGWKCQEPGCGSTDGLHAHHIKPQALGGKNVLENGVTLCRSHHYARHTGEMSTRAMGSEGKSKPQVKGISAPSEWWDMVDAAAKRHHTSRSALLRVFVTAYIEEQTTGELSPALARTVALLAS